MPQTFDYLETEHAHQEMAIRALHMRMPSAKDISTDFVSEVAGDPKTLDMEIRTYHCADITQALEYCEVLEQCCFTTWITGLVVNCRPVEVL